MEPFELTVYTEDQGEDNTPDEATEEDVLDAEWDEDIAIIREVQAEADNLK